MKHVLHKNEEIEKHVINILKMSEMPEMGQLIYILFIFSLMISMFLGCLVCILRKWCSQGPYEYHKNSNYPSYRHPKQSI